MSCFDSYITINESTPSRSGLYASDLPGIDIDMLDAIARDIDSSPEDDANTIWPVIYKRAKNNLISDVSKNMQDKFFLDLKLISRETSQFTQTVNTGSSLAGMQLEFWLPKYARLHIISIDVYSQANYSSGANIKVYRDDANGEVLDTISDAINTGRNTINVDTDYEANKVFIAYNPALYSLRQTENKQFGDLFYGNFNSHICDICYYGDQGFLGSFQQINGGGLDVKYLVYCSMEKYICDNIKLFADALLYKIGYEITIERRLGERLNKFTVMTQERWDELSNFYKAQYEQNLMNTITGCDVSEDQYCFSCKSTVRVVNKIP
jgi:hypothetical protein